jgi:hypothetical protein
MNCNCCMFIDRQNDGFFVNLSIYVIIKNYISYIQGIGEANSECIKHRASKS